MTAVLTILDERTTDDDRELSHISACLDGDCTGCVFDDVALCGVDLTGAHTCPDDMSCGCTRCQECLRIDNEFDDDEFVPG